EPGSNSPLYKTFKFSSVSWTYSLNSKILRCFLISQSVKELLLFYNVISITSQITSQFPVNKTAVSSV
ncbi:MAG: hypothetical protein QNK23_03370, partial [Crocinitomicaceae bacterium]|nr:hypothetical protein [Crocinitomicaceae bacterium]